MIGVSFSITYNLGSSYLVHTLIMEGTCQSDMCHIMEGTCQSDMCHFAVNSFSLSTDFVKFTSSFHDCGQFLNYHTIWDFWLWGVHVYFYPYVT